MKSIKPGASALYVTIEMIVMMVAGLYATLYISRNLGVESLGEWKLFTGALNITIYLFGLGLSITATKYVAERAKNSVASSFDLAWNLFVIRLLVSTSVVFFLLLFSNELNSIFNSDIFNSFKLSLLASAIFLNLICDLIGRAVITGFDKRWMVAKSQILGKLIFISSVSISLFFVEDHSIVIFFSCFCLGLLVELFYYLCLLYILKKNQIKTNDAEKRYEENEKIFTFAKHQWGFQLLQVFREYSVDSYVISFFKDIAAVGLFGAITVFPILLRSFSPARMFVGVIMPRVIHGSKDEKEKIKKCEFLYGLLQKLVLIIYLPILSFLFFKMDTVVAFVFGEDYLSAVSAGRILIFFLFFGLLADPYYQISNILGESKVILYSGFFGLLNFMLSVITVPYFGINGAAFSTGIVSVFILVYFNSFYSAKKINLVYPWKPFFVVSTFSFSAGFLVFFIDFSFVLLLLPIFIFSYIYILVKIKIFSDFENNIINQCLPMKIVRIKEKLL